VITGIVVALPEEISTLTSKKLTKGECFFKTESIVIVLSGMGKDNARIAAETLIENGAQRLLSWGCAGALTDALKPGDIVIARRCMSTKSKHYVMDGGWISHTDQVLIDKVKVINQGVLAGSEKICSTLEQKKEVAEKTGAVAIDMESLAVAEVAEKKNVPFLAIRAIADPLDFDFPQAVIQSMSAAGEVNLSQLVSYLVFHPFELWGLLKLALHFRAATKTLRLVSLSLESIVAF
jgi:adenosylhomocysteine nucleosidase